jgi:hypothetical protein
MLILRPIRVTRIRYTSSKGICIKALRISQMGGVTATSSGFLYIHWHLTDLMKISKGAKTSGQAMLSTNSLLIAQQTEGDLEIQCCVLGVFPKRIPVLCILCVNPVSSG